MLASSQPGQLAFPGGHTLLPVGCQCLSVSLQAHGTRLAVPDRDRGGHLSGRDGLDYRLVQPGAVSLLPDGAVPHRRGISELQVLTACPLAVGMGHGLPLPQDLVARLLAVGTGHELGELLGAVVHPAGHRRHVLRGEGPLERESEYPPCLAADALLPRHEHGGQASNCAGLSAGRQSPGVAELQLQLQLLG